MRTKTELPCAHYGIVERMLRAPAEVPGGDATLYDCGSLTPRICLRRSDKLSTEHMHELAHDMNCRVGGVSCSLSKIPRPLVESSLLTQMCTPFTSRIFSAPS
jgi:hypothetical protein